MGQRFLEAVGSGEWISSALPPIQFEPVVKGFSVSTPQGFLPSPRGGVINLIFFSLRTWATVQGSCFTEACFSCTMSPPEAGPVVFSVRFGVRSRKSHYGLGFWLVSLIYLLSDFTWVLLGTYRFFNKASFFLFIRLLLYKSLLCQGFPNGVWGTKLHPELLTVVVVIEKEKFQTFQR